MRALGIALAAAALLVAGCGEEEKTEADRVKDALIGYYSEIADGDVEAACEHVAGTPVADCLANAKRIAAQPDGAQRFEENTKALLKDKKPVIQGDLACIPVSTQSFDFQKIDGEWRVIRFGRELDNPRNCAAGLRAT